MSYLKEIFPEYVGPICKGKGFVTTPTGDKLETVDNLMCIEVR
jgi:hypothetical protein